jgi:exodeoxyribonuclease VII small subunit
MAKKTQQTPKTFEDAIQELEKILAEIESGDIGLEESLARYERGTFLVQHCRGVLAQAEKQIEQISKGPDGTLTTVPLEEKSE